jgi:hypothetical protein
MLAMNWLMFGIVFFAVGAVAVFVLWRVRRPTPADNPANWPETAGTIQAVRQVSVGSGRYTSTLDVADFSYVVNDEYYSGIATISRSFSSGDTKLSELVDKKFQVRYDPCKPDKFDLSQADTGGFILDTYDDLGTDIGPIDLNINKI